MGSERRSAPKRCDEDAIFRHFSSFAAVLVEGCKGGTQTTPSRYTEGAAAARGGTRGEIIELRLSVQCAMRSV